MPLLKAEERADETTELMTEVTLMAVGVSPAGMDIMPSELVRALMTPVTEMALGSVMMETTAGTVVVVAEMTGFTLLEY